MVARKSIPKMPSGVSDGPVDKRGAYGISRRALVSETEGGWSQIEEPDTGTRKPTQGEQEVPRSPAWPANRQRGRDWASPSYDATGRGHIFDNGGNRQIPDAGANTTSDTSNRKGRARPGRW